MDHDTDLLTSDDIRRNVAGLMRMRCHAAQSRDGHDRPGGGDIRYWRAVGYMGGIESVLVIALDIDIHAAGRLRPTAERNCREIQRLDARQSDYTSEHEEEIRGWVEGVRDALKAADLHEFADLNVGVVLPAAA